MCTVHFTMVSRPLMLAGPCAQNTTINLYISEVHAIDSQLILSGSLHKIHALSVE